MQRRLVRLSSNSCLCFFAFSFLFCFDFFLFLMYVQIKNVSHDVIDGKIGKIYMPDQKVNLLLGLLYIYEGLINPIS